MHYNRSEIMSDAHAAAKACQTSAFYAGWAYRRILAAQMRRVWGDAKCRVAAERRASLSEADRITEVILRLENKTRWSQVDYAEMSELRAMLLRSKSIVAPEAVEQCPAPAKASHRHVLPNSRQRASGQRYTARRPVSRNGVCNPKSEIRI